MCDNLDDEYAQIENELQQAILDTQMASQLKTNPRKTTKHVFEELQKELEGISQAIEHRQMEVQAKKEADKLKALLPRQGKHGSLEDDVARSARITKVYKNQHEQLKAMERVPEAARSVLDAYSHALSNELEVMENVDKPALVLKQQRYATKVKGFLKLAYSSTLGTLMYTVLSMLIDAPDHQMPLAQLVSTLKNDTQLRQALVALERTGLTQQVLVVPHDAPSDDRGELVLRLDIVHTS